MNESLWLYSEYCCDCRKVSLPFFTGVLFIFDVSQPHPHPHPQYKSPPPRTYIDKPLLLDGFKFDLRLYVLVTSVNPLRVYMYRDGLARLCTKPYVAPKKSNLKKLRMHLTNFAINGNSKDFEKKKADDKGSKRSFQSLLDHLRAKGRDADRMLRDIRCVLVKTVLAVHPLLKQGYRSYFGEGRKAAGSKSHFFYLFASTWREPFISDTNKQQARPQPRRARRKPPAHRRVLKYLVST